MLTLVVCFAVAVATRDVRDAECATNAQCFGGTCNISTSTSNGHMNGNGSCTCPPSWTGPRCQLLRLQPALPTAPGLVLRHANTSTWGGGAVQAADGTWHMFAARIARKCGLDAWWPNSEITQARSVDGPAGPYVPVSSSTGDSDDDDAGFGPLRGAFAHGPKPVWLADGTLALVHIGCGDGSTQLVAGCTNGTTPSNWTRPSNRSRCNQPGWADVLRSSDGVRGPWARSSDTAGPGLSVDGGTGAWHTSTGLTNPALWPLNASAVLLAYSAGCADCAADPGHKHVGIAVGRASKAGDSTTGSHSGFDFDFVDLTPRQPVFPWATEDPAVWRDRDSGAWHLVAHRTSSTGGGGPGGDSVASHAVAATPFGPWTLAELAPYSRDIVWDSGNGSYITTHVQKRERPQPIFDRNGSMVAFANGVRPGRAATPLSPEGETADWTYTHVQLIG